MDAEALFTAGRLGCAYYIAGYAVECALKACIAKQTKAESFPPRDSHNFWVHQLDALLKFAGLKDEMEPGPDDEQIDKERKQRLKLNWSVVREWSEDSRYESARVAPEAGKILEAIKDPQYGVQTWLKNRW